MVTVVGLAIIVAAQEEDAPVVAALAPRAETLLVARCTVCHSEDLITQQRLPRPRWKATVEKMKQWGAEISQDEADLLVRYLSARFHPGAPDRLASLGHQVGAEELLKEESRPDGPVVGLATRGAGVFQHNCQACHGAGAGGGIGPKLAKSPILKHEDAFWETVLHGRGSMPAWGTVLSHQDIADIHAWLLTR
jgi:cytochrome c oxidase cbb3-type subunit III